LSSTARFVATGVRTTTAPDAISEANPLKVLIAGGGVGGLALANVLSKNPAMSVTVLERTQSFKRFGGPIQLASNALKILSEMDENVYNQVMEKFTFTGDKKNGIKDGIRDDWYAMFDLSSPAESRGMPYTGVIERPDLQDIYLSSLPENVMQNGNGVTTYTKTESGSVVVELESGDKVEGDVLIGADGIWSAVRATMNNEPVKGEGSGATYSGYTVFAGELDYPSFDNGQVGYKVYIGPGQYFVITDIGNGRYQWYAFLARPAGSSDSIEKPEGSSLYLQNIFAGWSKDVHHILKATQEDEIDQRDLYDRPPSVRKPWTDGHVALLGDASEYMFARCCCCCCLEVLETCFSALTHTYSTLSSFSYSSRDDAQLGSRWMSSYGGCLCFGTGIAIGNAPNRDYRKARLLPQSATCTISSRSGIVSIRFRHYHSWL
jgi:zeaxanthin epoxidase